MRRLPALTNRIVMATLLAVALLILLFVGWRNHHERKLREDAGQQLRLIYNALQRYETRNGALPVLALYPLDPMSGTDSIRYELARYLPDPSVFVSPNSHDLLKKTGLTYLWNPAFNGGRLKSGDKPDWLLIDMQALRPEVTKAHLGGYLTLYSDGTISLLSGPPPSLLRYQK